MADFPIATSWLSEWISREIVDSNVSFYSIGAIINKLISTLVNGTMIDRCYMNGVSTFLQFGVKSDFCLFDKGSPESNGLAKDMNEVYLNLKYYQDNDVSYDSGCVDLTKKMLHFFKKESIGP